MRKIILVTAMVLASATAQAGGTRSLTLASSDQPVAVEQSKPVGQKVAEQTPAETPKAIEAPAGSEAPKYTARPAAVGTAPEAPRAAATNPVVEKTSRAARSEQPRRRRESTEARVIRELHRHGIYW